MKPTDLTEDKVFEILTWLSVSDAKYAAAKADLESAEILRKRVRQRVWHEADGTAGERAAEAEISDDAQAADDAYIAALRAFETLKGQRQTANMLVEIYRTLESSRRAGSFR